MMTDHTAPTAACARVAPLLPLLDEAAATDESARQARAHLSGCAYCQAERARYIHLDSALRQRFATTSVARRPTEEIMRYIADQATTPVHPPTAPHRSPLARASRRSWLSGVAAIASVVALITLAVALFVARGNAGYGGPPRYSFPGVTGVFASVSMVSPTEGWALAQVTKTAAGKQPLDEVTFYHDLNGTWTPVTVKTAEDFAVGGVSGFNGTISMDSATDGWAVAHNFNRVSAVLHFSQGEWTEVGAPYLQTLQALGPQSVWGIEGSQPGGAAIVRFDGTSWIPQAIPASTSQSATQPTPDATVGGAVVAADPTYAATSATAAPTPTAISTSPTSGAGAGSGAVIAFHMDSATAGWALVQEGNARYAMARYADARWAIATPVFGSSEVLDFTTFAMVSATEGWVLGEQSVPDDHGITAHVPLQELVYHYANGRWTSVPLPMDAGTFTTLTAITMLSPSDGWIVGAEQSAYPGATTSNFQSHPLLFHYTAGLWHAVTVPQTGTPVAGITQVAFAADGTALAVGYESNIPASQVVQDTDLLAQASPLLWTYDGHTWSMA